MIEMPPHLNQEQAVTVFTKNISIDLIATIDKINDEYAYWDKVKYIPTPSGMSAPDLWACVKASRLLSKKIVWMKYGISLTLTNQMQRWCHEFDMNFGGSWGADSIIADDNRKHYLVSSIMEEAISSSQMEGASTTRKVAKDMLHKNLTPKDKSQQMIFNNYQTIRYIVDNKDKPLSVEMLCEIHRLMTENTLDNPADAGRFRLNNDVVVENAITHETVHTPPSHEEIPEFIADLCHFFNDTNSTTFIHPIIRGIIVHFMIAYVHPFVDGNGRTARALFYWYMLKQGYWLTEYLSVSRIIASSKKAYEKSFLYTEADGNDIGYFVHYNLKVLEKAFKALQKYIKRKQDERHAAARYLHIGNINERQTQIIQMFSDDPQIVVTVKDLQLKFYVSPTTAKHDIMGLVERGILTEIAFNRVKRGYIRSDKFESIVNKH
ncbi:MAG: Fic family protein [Alistipes sp.]|nr:Fic family protein [Alistipes sp.]